MHYIFIHQLIVRQLWVETLGDHFSAFVDDRIKMGCFQTTSEAVRAGLRLLEVDEAKLDILREKLAVGIAQAENSETVDGESFMKNMLQKYD